MIIYWFDFWSQAQTHFLETQNLTNFNSLNKAKSVLVP